ncbi:MAG TPA: ferredoxin [Streptosporangiaceae bacterium]|jgi:ferredoxin|nr:ferredoxin [Streptosporangiaceae bacterium]
MTYRVEIDSDVCISSGMCVSEAPDLFRFDEDDIAEMIPGGPTLPDAALLRLARTCPSGALQIFDGDDQIDVF